MMRALAFTLLVACNAPPDPEVAFVIASADELGALHSAAAGIPSIGFAATDAPAQRRQVERAIDLGVRVIVLEPMGAAADLVDLAHQRGVRVIAYGREPAGHSDGDTVDALVSFDGYRAGVLQATAALDAIAGGRGHIALVDEPDAMGLSVEIARGYAHTLAPYIARGDITIVEDLANADAVLATSGTTARSLLAKPAFVASAGGDNTDLVCAGRQQLDVRFDRADLASAAGAIVKRIVAGEDLVRDPQTIRLPNRRLPVELARVHAFTAADCAARAD